MVTIRKFLKLEILPGMSSMPKIGITAVRETWEKLAQQDALWAILTSSSKKARQWEITEFMGTGVKEIETVLTCVQDAGLVPNFTGSAVDFGCGVGRLTRALAQNFSKVIGVDIASTMIATAKELHTDAVNCEFVLNVQPNLRFIRSSTISFVYSNIVLQHMPGKFAAAYLKEFVRILQPGGIMVFQIADSPAGNPIERIRYHLRPRTRLRQLLGMKPMMMYSLREDRVRRAIAPAQVVSVCWTNATDGEFSGDLKYLEHPPITGLPSKQYCCVKSMEQQVSYV
jgi:SAM-dependent methyltransferase